MEGALDLTLLRAVRRGEYSIDPRAVADAIVSRRLRVRRSGVLVAAQLFDGLAVASGKDEPRALGDLS